MRLPKGFGLELVVAGLTLAAAGAFAHAAVSGQPVSVFTAVEREADELGAKLFLGDCQTCHARSAPKPRQDPVTGGQPGGEAARAVPGAVPYQAQVQGRNRRP